MATPQQKAVAAARLAREELGAGHDAPLADVLTIVEGPGGVPVTIAELGSGISGALVVERDAPFVLINGEHVPARQRFTLAHEFGHWRLGHGTVVDGLDYLSGRHPHEVEANYFAAEFLVPVRAVQNWMEARGQPPVDLRLVVELAHDFGVSARPARIRLEEARYLSAPQARALDREIELGQHKPLELRFGLTGPQDGIAAAKGSLPRLPAKLRENALAGYESGLLNVERLAQILRRDKAQVEHDLDSLGIKPPEDEEADW